MGVRLFRLRRPQQARPVQTEPSRLGTATNRTDLLLGLAGVSMAIGSAAFATHMIVNTDRKPEFAGIEYLSIFSRPTHPMQRREFDVAGVDRGRVDYQPVGSISRNSKSAVLDDFDVVDVNPNGALIHSRNGQMHRVSAGDTLPGAGRILSIGLRQHKWVVWTEQGHIEQRD